MKRFRKGAWALTAAVAAWAVVGVGSAPAPPQPIDLSIAKDKGRPLQGSGDVVYGGRSLGAAPHDSGGGWTSPAFGEWLAAAPG